ncbi:MAG: CRISPR system precrRNA processing endoribonuclease RAMP protein Cas6 [Anaerolineales bacterium]|nr:CRISPR system precrRNA processing endoribonuclease RAMP protein Cas6 [Anaerolineales bacterium]
MTSLQLTHLRFDCIATTPIKLGGHHAGNSLRNALANVMRRAVCPETSRRGDPTPEHAATCPACWLLSANLDPGTVVRAYALIPPTPPQYDLQPGDRFAFGLTLFGDGFRFLPYFVLAINEMGQTEGIGPSRREGNGRFVVETITAVNPLRGDVQLLLTPEANLVQVPTVHVDWTAVSHISRLHGENLPPTNELTVRFLTPIRLEEQKRPFKTPDFSVFFRRTLYRIDELNRQFAGEARRDPEQVTHLHALADRVRLVEADTRWHEIWVYSGRKQRKTPLSGFTGTAVYRTDDWTDLMPWLVFGQAVQAGKSVVKGNGVFELAGGEWPVYWQWMQEKSLLF